MTKHPPAGNVWRETVTFAVLSGLRWCWGSQQVLVGREIAVRKQDMLEVKHVHTVFTILSELNALVLQNRRELYSLLFRVSADTVREFTTDPKYLRASIGFLKIVVAHHHLRGGNN